MFMLPFTLALAVSACDTNSQETPPAAASSEEVAVCHFDTFSVEITQGPSAGLKLAGQLVAVEGMTTGRLYGMLNTDEASIPWTGQYTPGAQVSVAFQVDDKIVSGVGPISGSLCADASPIEGIAFGPTVGDSFAVDGTDVGHWILDTPAQSAFMLNYGDPLEASLGQILGGPVGGGETNNLTAGGGVVRRNECTGCGGMVSGGTCVGPATVAEGSQAFAMCISPLIRNGGVVAALIQYFDL
jgi:hypothetical protein